MLIRVRDLLSSAASAESELFSVVMMGDFVRGGGAFRSGGPPFLGGGGRGLTVLFADLPSGVLDRPIGGGLRTFSAAGEIFDIVQELGSSAAWFWYHHRTQKKS